jgi:hypothetical protein
MAFLDGKPKPESKPFDDTGKESRLNLIEDINATKSISSRDPPIHLHNVANQWHRCPVVITSRTPSSVDRGIVVIDKSTSIASETLRSRSSPRNIIRDSTHTADNLWTHRNSEFSTKQFGKRAFALCILASSSGSSPVHHIFLESDQHSDFDSRLLDNREFCSDN